MNKDEKWMQIAIQEAKKAENEGEVPVGAILVQDGKLIAKAYNQSISKNDATAHAEIQLLRLAGQKLGNYRLKNSTIYVTLEPCVMCFGAIMHARISHIIFGARDHRTGACGSSIDLVNKKCFNHKIETNDGILEAKCIELLQNFFKSKR